MIIGLVVLLALSILLNGFLLYGLLNAAKKMVIYDDFCEGLVRTLAQVVTDMRAIDIRGSFEADDEVGDIFKTMLHMVAALKAFLPPEIFNEKEEDG